MAAKRASIKISDGDIGGAVRSISSRDTIVVPSSEAANRIHQLHKPTPADRRPTPNHNGPSLTASSSDVMGAIRSFADGSAGGSDGLKPQHVKDMLDGRGHEDTLLSSITDLVNLIIAGQVPEVPYLFGGSITAISKKGGGIRSIVVGSYWRRLAAKICSQHVAQTAASYLAPLQVEFGTAGGAETAVHAARSYSKVMTPEDLMLKCDFENAFGSIRRDSMLEAVASRSPEILPLVTLSYGSETILFFGEHTISSTEGIQQGDPLGPWLFCITTYPLLSRLQSDFKVCYLDDVTLAGDCSTVLSDLSLLEKDGAEIGLSLNLAKTEMVAASAPAARRVNEQNPAIASTSKADACLLGSPLFAEGLNNTLSVKVADLKTMISRLQHVSAHEGLFLLRNALSLPELLHTLRSAPCAGHPALAEYDQELREGLSSILNVDLTGDCWSQAALPVKMGGLGIRRAEQLAPSAYLASHYRSASLVAEMLHENMAGTQLQSQPQTVTDALACWHLLTPADSVPPCDDAAGNQKAWDNQIAEFAADSLLNATTDPLSRARLVATRSPWSGDWLNTLPLPAIGLRMDDETTRIACGLRVGASLVASHTCKCGANVKADGVHGLSYGRSTGRHPRHSHVNEIIHRTLVKAGISADLEPTNLCTDGRRPDGATTFPWARGRRLVWDFACTDPLALSYIESTGFNSCG